MDPIARFVELLERAKRTPSVADPTGMTLSTVGVDGRPSGRVVLLKGIDAQGLVFYTNNRSLGRHRDEVAGRLDRISDGREEDCSKESATLWHDLLDLFDLVDRGRQGGERAVFAIGRWHGQSARPLIIPIGGDVKSKRFGEYAAGGQTGRSASSAI